MGKWISDVLATLIPKNIAGIIGVVESLVQPIRELVMVALRLADVIFTILGQGEKMDPIILAAGKIFDTITSAIKKVKDFLLGVGE